MTVPVLAGTTAEQLAQLQTLRHADNGRLQADRRDSLGTTHHEAGTLRMSVNAAEAYLVL